MSERRSTRRRFLGALIGGVAMLGLGRHDEARAVPIGDSYGSKAAFKKDCEAAGGTFIDSPKDILTVCVYPDGDRKTCDQKGNNCTLVKSPQGFDTSPLHPIGGLDGLPTFDSNITPAEAPVPRVSGGKKRRSGGKRRR